MVFLISQISNLNKGIIAQLLHKQHLHAMRWITWERRDLARTHLSRPSSSTTINLSNSFSICIFPKKQGLEEKSRIVTFCNRVDTEIERRTDRIRRRCTIQNIVRIRQLAAESKHHHSFT